MNFKRGNVRGQVTIFIIIALVIVGVTITFFVLKDKIIVQQIPTSVEPVYASFLTCVEEYTLIGIDLLESQAGYIELPDFDPGSMYMPFSNQLDFLGTAVPYWYYVSSTNIQKTQIPSKSSMEEDLANFVEEKIHECNLESYYSQGFKILRGEAKAKINIEEKLVEVSLDLDLNVEKEEDKIIIKDHYIEVNSHLGKLYDSAIKIYEQEQDEMFLEKYAVDTLRLYAPVDGVELSCAPQTWVAEEVFEDLRNAIEANTLALKTNNGIYDLQNKEDKYFIVDVDIDEDVRFLASKKWPYSFEVDPSEGNVLMAEPVGNQPGLGILGFCYVPYHFVYNIRYPVLVQVYSETEIFQFPMAVVLQGNNPREPIEGSALVIEAPELCEHKNTMIHVNTYNVDMSSVESNISYECFGTKCDIGDTELGVLSDEFPQCVNGYVIAEAEGYKDAKYLLSTTNEASVDIILDRLYEMNLELTLDGSPYGGNAMINVLSDDFSQTIIYPDNKKIELSEGQYEFQVYVYKESNLKLEGTSTEKCVDVPKSGLGGLVGLTKEKCFDINIPAQVVSNALSGGGKQNYYILESIDLQGKNTITIGADSLPTPTTINKLQNNYILFEEKGLEVNFK